MEKSLKSHRAGLALVLAELPNYIGAYHTLGSNSIVMNKTLLNVVRSLSKNRRAFNSYVYSILMHEYLHSLGIISEADVRRLVKKISMEFFDPKHPAVRIATDDIWNIFPEFKFLGPGRSGRDFELIKDFDRSSTTYIG